MCHRTSPHVIILNPYLGCSDPCRLRNLAEKQSVAKMPLFGAREMVIGCAVRRSDYQAIGTTAAKAASAREIESVCDPRATAFAVGTR
jgi:hypothetical protein